MMRRIWIYYAACGLFGLGAIISRIWLTEDAFIVFRTLDNLYDGYGFVFNPGEIVEGITHPGWSICLIVLRGLGIPFTWGAAILGLACTLSGLAILFVRGVKAKTIPVAVLALCTISGFRDFATSGLEFSLVFLLLVLFFQEIEDHGFKKSPIYISFLLNWIYLCRPETALLLLYYSVIFLLTILKKDSIYSKMDWKAAFKNAIAWGIPCVFFTGTYHIFRWLYYGDIFPNTYYAKAGLGSYYSQGFKYLFHFFWNAPGFTVATCVLLALLLLHKTRNRMSSDVILSTLRDIGAALLVGFYIVRVGGDFMAFRFLLVPASIAAIALDRVFRETHPIDLKENPLKPAYAVLGFAILTSFWPVPMAQGYIANERAIFKSIGAGSVTRSDNEWARMGRRFGKLQACLAYADFWISNSMTDAKCLKGIGLGYFGVEAGPAVKIMDEQALTDRSLARKQVLIRFRPGHEHYAKLEDVIEKKVLFCATGEPAYDRIMKTNAGIVIRLDPELLATLPQIRERLNQLIQLKNQGSVVIPRLEQIYGHTVEELYRQSAAWSQDSFFTEKNQCWNSFEGNGEGFFY